MDIEIADGGNEVNISVDCPVDGWVIRERYDFTLQTQFAGGSPYIACYTSFGNVSEYVGSGDTPTDILEFGANSEGIRSYMAQNVPNIVFIDSSWTEMDYEIIKKKFTPIKKGQKFYFTARVIDLGNTLTAGKVLIRMEAEVLVGCVKH